MVRFLLLFGLLATALAANAALFFRAEDQPTLPSGETRAVIGGTRLVVPRAYVRETAHWAGGRLEKLDLVMLAENFAPIAPQNIGASLTPEPERITLTLTQASTASGAAERFQLLYARFVSAETRNRADGLVTRGFRPGTPYDDREIHIGAGIGRHFYAICAKGAAQAVEPCSSVMTIGTVQVEIRFPAARLAEWRRIGTESARLIETWRAAAEPQPQS